MEKIITQREYQGKILGKLIEKYEKSAAFISGVSSRRTLLVLDKTPDVEHSLENPDNKRSFISAICDLKKDKLIGFEWVRYEENNLVNRIWLITESLSLKASYRRIGRKMQAEVLDELHAMLNQTLETLSVQNESIVNSGEPSSDRRNIGNHEKSENNENAKSNEDAENKVALEDYLTECVRHIESRKKIPAPFTEDMTLNRDILKLTEGFSEAHGECMERLLSSRLYGDSKRYEKAVKPKALSLMKILYKKSNGTTTAQDDVSDEELMMQYGITRWPEILHFTGNISVVTDDEKQIDFSTQGYGAYMNSATLTHVLKVTIHDTDRILFIENLANYIWYIHNVRQPDEIVLWHGGFLSPVRKSWFRMIIEAAGDLPIRHWSDIDLGGFRIFVMLQRNVAPLAVPWKMDLATLLQYKDRTISLQEQEHDSYLQVLEKCLKDPEYKVFYEVIRYMLEHRVKLEQEQMIL